MPLVALAGPTGPSGQFPEPQQGSLNINLILGPSEAEAVLPVPATPASWSILIVPWQLIHGDQFTFSLFKLLVSSLSLGWALMGKTNQ